jgi:hypothetical protein
MAVVVIATQTAATNAFLMHASIVDAWSKAPAGAIGGAIATFDRVSHKIVSGDCWTTMCWTQPHDASADDMS